MARAADTYSRIVGLAKIALPLIALGILSTVFLVSRTVDPEATLPFSEAELEEMLREERIGNPAYAGLTDDGSAVAVGAAVAGPDPENPGLAQAREMQARIDTVDGGWVDIEAESGQVDESAGLARLAGGVRMVSSTGYDVETAALTTYLRETRLESDGPVVAVGPPGTVEAGKVVLQQSDDGRYLLEFTDGVRLVYTPPTSEGESP